MKAQIINEFGNPNVFILEELPRPSVKEGHVLVRVFATSINPLDCKIRSGQLPHLAPNFPAILQGDVAGVVEAVGEGVKKFKVGDEVYGYAGGIKGLGGSLSEYLIADERLLAAKPGSITMQEAAALPLVTITAWLGLFQKLQVDAGDTLLIQGGVGGVGHIALQLAKWCGAKVIVTVRSEQDIHLAKSLGADEAINIQNENLQDTVEKLTNSRGFELIFDTVGGTNLSTTFELAAENGQIVTTNSRCSIDLAPMHKKGLSLHVISMLIPILRNRGREAYGDLLKQVAGIIKEGKLKPLLDPHRYALEEAQQAHELLESGQATGKVVITINEEDMP